MDAMGVVSACRVVTAGDNAGAMTVPIRNIVFGCPEGTWSGERWEGPPRVLAEFYAALLGLRVIREDWLVIAADETTLPRLAFGEGSAELYEPPRWPDPKHPQQVHLDVSVTDTDGVEDLVLGLGATTLQNAGTYRSYADPIGHPFCLYPTASQQPGPRVDRVVFDCPDPAALARFYAELLGWTVTMEESPGRVVIADGLGAFPMLGFQRAADYLPPQWPDPRHPQQLHLDFHVQEGTAVGALAERLGASRMPEMGGSCPVYTDPAAHPFCLCSPGE
jgi:catechol 2,3-dioxygenase-like lactoylglutathione lyase family enzyme